MIKKHPSITPTHPGEYLREIVLPAMDLSKVEIARALGISRQHLYDILNEKQPVTATTALRLGKFFGTSAKSWLNMQTAYDLEMAARVTDLSTVPVAKSA